MTASPKWYPVAAAPVLVTTIFMAYVAQMFFTVRSSKSVPPTKHVLQPEIENQQSTPLPKWARIFSRSDTPALKEQRLQESYDLNNIVVNDPSRLARRSTDRSLADHNFIPPQSTVQYLPSAYDLSSGLMPTFGSSERQTSLTTHNGSIGDSAGRNTTFAQTTSGTLRRPFNFESLDEDPEV
jgi:hypothetical protein